MAETAYLGWALPETRWWGAKKGGNTHGAGAEEADEKATAVQRESVQERRRRIDRLGRVHGVFLLCFSGVGWGAGMSGNTDQMTRRPSLR